MKGAKVAAGLFFLVGFMCFVGATFIAMNRESSGAGEALKKAEAVNERIDKLDKSLGDLNRILTNDMVGLRQFCGGINERGSRLDEKVTKNEAKIGWMELKVNNLKPLNKPIEVTILSTPGSRKAAQGSVERVPAKVRQ